MSIFDKLISVLAPFDCLNCGVEGKILCRACTYKLPVIPSRCYRCNKQTVAYRTCSSCRSTSALYCVQPATVYGVVAQKVVWALKYKGAQEAASCIAAHMYQTANLKDDSLLVPCPTSAQRRRHRGFDQAELIARKLARATGCKMKRCLVRTTTAQQVGAGRTQRFKQLEGAYRVRRPSKVQNKHIVLVDDVLTTGATLEAAAKAFRLAGAKTVSALVFAQV